MSHSNRGVSCHAASPAQEQVRGIRAAALGTRVWDQPMIHERFKLPLAPGLLHFLGRHQRLARVSLGSPALARDTLTLRACYGRVTACYGVLRACYSMLRACYSVLQRATGVLQRGSSPLGDTCEFVLGIMTSLFYYDEFVLGMRPFSVGMRAFRFGMCPLRFVYVCSSFGFFCCLVRGCV